MKFSVSFSLHDHSELLDIHEQHGLLSVYVKLVITHIITDVYIELN